MITRPKNRYILVESSARLDFGDRLVSEGVLGSLASEIGTLGFVKANPKIVHNVGGRGFIIRVNRGHEDSIVLALSFIKRISGSEVGFYTIKTSGTIRKLMSVVSA